MVVDDIEQEAHQHLADSAFSPDGRRLGYAAADHRGQFIVADGVAGRAYVGILRNTLLFSPDSCEFVYGAHDGAQQFVVRNAAERGRYYGVLGTPRFSPDSRHLLYAANDSSRQFVVIDDEPCRPFDYIVIGENETFSADSRHVAYVVKQGEYQHVVIDHEPGAGFDGILARSVCFSPDSHRTASAARTGNQRFVVCDGIRHAPHGESIWSLTFSRCSQHLAYIAMTGRRHVVVVDDQVVHECDGTVSTVDGRAVCFDDDSSIRVITLVGGRLYSVKLEL